MLLPSRLCSYQPQVKPPSSIMASYLGLAWGWLGLWMIVVLGSMNRIILPDVGCHVCKPSSLKLLPAGLCGLNFFDARFGVAGMNTRCRVGGSEFGTTGKLLKARRVPILRFLSCVLSLPPSLSVSPQSSLALSLSLSLSFSFSFCLSVSFSLSVSLALSLSRSLSRALSLSQSQSLRQMLTSSISRGSDASCRILPRRNERRPTPGCQGAQARVWSLSLAREFFLFCIICRDQSCSEPLCGHDDLVANWIVWSRCSKRFFLLYYFCPSAEFPNHQGLIDCLIPGEKGLS